MSKNKDLRSNEEIAAAHSEIEPILNGATVTRETFDLKSVKINPSGGLIIKCKCRGITSCGTIDEIELKPKEDAHPDLAAHMQNLREYLAIAYKQLAAFLVVEPEAKKLDKKIATKLTKLKKDVINDIKVYQIDIGGVNEKRGVVIHGSMNVLNERRDGFKTTRIVFSGTDLGFEKDVEAYTENVIEEVKKYLFENKRAQANLFQETPASGDPKATEDANKKVAEFEVKDAEEVKAN